MRNKIKRKQSTGFTQVSNNLILSPYLSMKAKAVYCYFWSRPEGWIFSASEIQKNFKEGRDSIRSAIKELIEAGWIIRHPRKEEGQFRGYDYDVFCNPAKITGDGFPGAGETVDGYTPIPNNTDYSNTEKENIKESSQLVEKPVEGQGGNQECEDVSERKNKCELSLKALDIYKAYPTKCPIRKASKNKYKKHKEKICKQ